jgi:hypothetical protein
MPLPLIDGDVLIHLACRDLWKEKAKIDKRNNISFVKLDQDGHREVAEFTKEEKSRLLRKYWKIFHEDLKELLSNLYCTDFLMAVKGSGNFRDTLYPNYKANRSNSTMRSLSSNFVPVMRKLAVHEGLAISSDGREADDFLRIWAEECKSINKEYIICSIDKDLKCIPGKYYNIKTKKLEVISEDTAKRNYYGQLLQGDPTDNIPGIPGCGPKTASKMLADCITDEEFQEEVVGQYIVEYADDWYQYLLSNGKMIHLQKNINDYFAITNWPVVQGLI